MIISASRRTDIPAFYGEWFMNRLREGFCLVANPFNPANVSHVSLLPEDVDVIVFWSKNPRPFLSHLDDLDRTGFRYYFLFTVNSYPKSLEPNLPPLDERIRTFRKLSRRLGQSYVVWRYDPIILSRKMDAAYHLNSFRMIAESLADTTERVVLSFVDFYRKTERRLVRVEAETGDAFCRAPFPHAEFEILVRGLVSVAAQYNLEIQTCAEDPCLEDLGIVPGKCIDDELIRRVFGIAVSSKKDPGQRKECRCVVSKDIGATDSCLHGCEYCYSTVSVAVARARAARHNPSSPVLIPASQT